MSLTPPPFDEAAIEQALDPTWRVPQPRFRYWTERCLELGWPLGGVSVIPEFLAGMSQESQLDNMVIGNNPKIGTPSTSQGYITVGYSFAQIDSWTGRHVEDTHGIKWSPEWLRAHPLNPLKWLRDYGPLADLILYEGSRTWFNTRKWAAWDPKRIDPKRDENGVLRDENGNELSYHPLEEALAAWDAVNA